jgi:hypothetical protein
MPRSRHPLLSLSKDFIIGLLSLAFFILGCRIVKEVGMQIFALSPVEPGWFFTSPLRAALSLVFLLSFIVILGRVCQALFGRRLATTPGFRRLVRSVAHSRHSFHWNFSYVSCCYRPGASLQS